MLAELLIAGQVEDMEGKSSPQSMASSYEVFEHLRKDIVGSAKYYAKLGVKEKENSLCDAPAIALH